MFHLLHNASRRCSFHGRARRRGWDVAVETFLRCMRGDVGLGMRDGDVWDKLVELFSWFQSPDGAGDKDGEEHLEKFVAENKSMKKQSEDGNIVVTHPRNPEHHPCIIKHHSCTTINSIQSNDMIINTLFNLHLQSHRLSNTALGQDPNTLFPVRNFSLSLKHTSRVVSC